MKMGATKYDLWIRDGGRCSACNVVIDKIDIAHMQYDHILPRSLPYAIDELFTGKEHDILLHSIHNLRLVHPMCNTARGKLITLEAAKKAQEQIAYVHADGDLDTESKDFLIKFLTPVVVVGEMNATVDETSAFLMPSVTYAMKVFQDLGVEPKWRNFASKSWMRVFIWNTLAMNNVDKNNYVGYYRKEFNYAPTSTGGCSTIDKWVNSKGISDKIEIPWIRKAKKHNPKITYDMALAAHNSGNIEKYCRENEMSAGSMNHALRSYGIR